MARRTLRGLVYLVAAVLVLVAAALALLETGWAKDRIRALAVSQANRYLTASLQIGRLEGSVLRGIRLEDVRLTRGDQPIVSIDEVSLSYSLRELWQTGTVIRTLRVTRPRVFIARDPDGRWNVAALVRPRQPPAEPRGPGRSFEIASIEVTHGEVVIAEPMVFGPAHVPTHFTSVDVALSFHRQNETSTLVFRRAAWTGTAPALDMTAITGTLAIGPGGWQFDRFAVRTPRSSFALNGRVGGGRGLDLDARADRFAFQEWSGIINGLRNIAVAARFSTHLTGPEDRLATTIDLDGTGGSVAGALTLNTKVPGWHGAGRVRIGRLDLSRWLNRPERPSDITGLVTFDLDLDLGGRFPRGTYRFEGPHAAFMGYAADNVRTHGRVTSIQVEIADATALAYGAAVAARAGSTIGLSDPFPFRFRGTVAHIDLRRLPKPVPVPHVESRLTFEYDVTGRFSDPYIAGRAEFDDSVFLGASIRPGTVGTIDTLSVPMRYAGEGDVDGIDVNRIGAGLDVAWMKDPRYAGDVSGHFRVDGSGTDRESTVLDASGRIRRATIFRGTVADADVTLAIANGTLTTSFNGGFDCIDPTVPLADDRFAGTLTGTADVRATVTDLLRRTPALLDYDVEGSVALNGSTLRGFAVASANVAGLLRNGTARFTNVEVASPAITGSGSGVVAFTRDAPSSFEYAITRADLAQFPELSARGVSGTAAARGRMSGPFTALRFVGEGSAESLSVADVSALSSSLAYDVTVPSLDLAQATARLDGSSSLNVSGRQLERAAAIVTLSNGRVGIDVKVQPRSGPGAGLLADVMLHVPQRSLDVVNATVTLGRSAWQLARSDGQMPSVRWSGTGIAIDPMTFAAGPSRDERIGIGGDWRRDGTGSLRVTASHVFLETLGGAVNRPGNYGGVLDLDATLRGTPVHPVVSADVTVTSGRVRRVTYEKLAGRVEYKNDTADVDVRLDQSPGVWLTARGKVPRSLVDSRAPDQPVDVAVLSSPISLGLLEGVTTVVRNVVGLARIDVHVIGTGRDPHFQGAVDLARASFQVAATGVSYQNARATIRLEPDRINVESMHVEDGSGRPLDLHGSLGTHELRVGDLEIDGTARRFEVLRNELGRIDVDANVRLRGRFETPRLAGSISISAGSLRVDNILERAMFQPYTTDAAAAPAGDIDPMAAVNPWDRLGLDLSLAVPNTLKLVGENVQVSPGTPIGLGNINLRVAGDLYLYKDPAQPLSVTGSFDSVSGTYNFQGRQFEVDPSSSINFRGDLNPDLYVSVTRNISGVLTRVTINGPLEQPELHLSSTPPLDSSDILSLIVFNTTPNQLSVAQQQELAVRAGTLAAGFIATPIVTALQKEIGIEVLQIEPAGDIGTSPKITVGEEIAPGLVARFSQQFGAEPYSEATIEYYLSRILRLRATFSDAQALEARSPFRRIERAGIDLLFFFSF